MHKLLIQQIPVKYFLFDTIFSALDWHRECASKLTRSYNTYSAQLIFNIFEIYNSKNIYELKKASTTNPEYEYEYYIDGIEERGKRKKKKKNKNKQQNNSLNNYIATTPTTTTTRITLPPNAYAGQSWK